MDKPKCKNDDCEVVQANAGITSNIPYWYCKDCKVEVEERDPHLDLQMEFERLTKMDLRVIDGIPPGPIEIDPKEIDKAIEQIEAAKVALEENPCAPRNREWYMTPRK